MKKALTFFIFLVSLNLVFGQMSVPTPYSPSNGGEVYSLSTTLYWNTVSCNYYDYQYDTTANFDSPLLYSGTRSSSYGSISISGLQMETTYYWRVRARTYSDTSAWSPISTFTVPGLTIHSPADGAVVGSSTVYIDYSLPNDAYLYYALDTVPTFDSPFYTTGEGSSFSLTYFGKPYYWKVRAYVNGEYKPWTETRMVTLSTAGPRLSSPANDAAVSGSSPELSWYNYDENYDYNYASVQVQYDLVPTFDSPSLYETTTSNNYLSTSISYFSSGTRVYWRVRYNNGISASDWSETRSFTFFSGSQPTSPVNGETVSTLSPYLYFSGISGYYVNYEVRCDTTPEFNSGALVTNSYSPYYSYTGDTYSCYVSGLRFNRNYYWQVRTTYNSTTSDWSVTANFRTPSTLTLYSPQSGSEQSPSVELYWGSMDGVDSHICWIDTVPTFNSGALIRVNDYYDYASVTVPYLGKTYYWKVGACTQNDTCWSEVWNFHVSDEVTLSYPANGSSVTALAMGFGWSALGNSYLFNLDTTATFNSPAAVSYSPTENYKYIEDLKFGQRYYWRVSAVSGGEPQTWSDVWSFTVDDRVTPTSPADGTMLSSTSTYLNWYYFDGVEEYQVQLDTVATFNSPAMQYYSSSYEEYYLSSLEYSKNYYWRVKAIRGADESEWSETMHFTTSNYLTLYSPSNGSITSSISEIYFNWNYNSSSYYYNNYYQIQYDTLANFSSPLAAQSLQQINYNNYAYLYDFEPNKTYYWHIRLLNSNDYSPQAWSETWSFHTDASVAQSSPANGSTLSNYNTYLYCETYNVDGWYYQLDTTAAFNSPMLRTGNGSYDNYVSGLRYNTTYYWRVAGYHGTDTLAWSDVWSFTPTANVEPYLPENGSTLTGFNTELYCSYTNIYDWTYQLDTTPSFNSPALRTGNDYNTYVSSLQPNTTYYWRVAGLYNTDTTDWSEVWTFNTPDGSVRLISPANGNSSHAVTQYLNWENISGCNSYEYQCDLVNTFDSPALISGTRGSGYNFVTLNDLYYGRTTYWRVRCYIGDEPAGWSETWSFSTVGNTELSAPVSGSVLPYTSTELRWNPIQGSRTYQYQYDTTADFSSPAMQMRTTSNTYATVEPLYYGTTYSWRVRAIDDRDTSAWSDAWSFTTPGTVALSSPANGEAMTRVSNTFVWTGVIADTYLFQMDTVSTFDSPWLRSSNTYNYSISQSYLPYGHTLYWRVAAVNGIDQSAWSEVWTVTTPATITQTTPENASTIAGLSTSLQWETCTGTSSYRYQFDTVPTFDSPMLVNSSTSGTYASVSYLRYGQTYYWRVQGSHSEDVSAWSDTWTFNTPAAVTLFSPANGATDIASTVSLSWDQISGSTSYEYQYDIVPTFNSPAFVSGTRGSSYNYVSASSLQYNTTYYWRVRAINYNVPDTSDWSAVFHFQTSANVTLSSPANGSVSTTISNSLYWNSVNGSSYTYNLDTVSTFDSPALQRGNTSSTYVSFSNLYYGTTYFWRVQAYNNSSTSNWSEVWKFTTPSTIILNSPENGLVINTLSQTLSWNSCDGTNYYEYQLDTVPTFNSTALRSGNTYSTSINISDLCFESRIYWRVRGQNSVDVSDWSEVRYFNTSNLMTLSLPADDSTLSVVNPQISWNSYQGCSSYEYQYDTTATFDSPISYSSTTSYLYRNLSYLQYGATYYWHVRAYNGYDQSAWSDTWRFTTPSQITLSTPEQDAIVNTLSPSLYWNSCPGTSSYQYQYDTVATFDSPALYTGTRSSSYNYVSISGLQYDKRYYWRVRGYHSSDTSDWSPVWSFRTAGVVTLLTPENGSASTTISNSISWQGISGSNYIYDLDTVPTFDSPVRQSSYTSSTSRSFSNLYYGTTYYWRVAAYANGDTTVWSEVWTFTTPDRITLSTPVMAEVNTTLSQYFYWNTCTGTSTYQYQLDTVPTFDSPAAFMGTRSSSYNYVSLGDLFYENDIYWRVRGWNSVDTSDWSDTWYITTTGRQTLVSPTDGSVLSAMTQTLTWNSYPGSSYYQYEYDTTATFDSPSRIASTTYNTSASISNLIYDTRYYWHVRAINGRDTSAWSDAWSFTTPATITLLTPVDGTVSTTISNTITWQSISGSNYIYDLDTVPTFDSPVRQSSSTSATTRSFSNLYYGTTYYWRVAAYNSGDTSAWSEVWTFTTPAKIELSTPTIGTEVTYTLSQSLYWNTCSGTTTYQYQLDTVPTFDSPAAFVGTRSSSYNYVSLSNLFYESNIYWRVRGWNSVDTSDWSDTWYFTTVGRMQLTTPADGTDLTMVNQTLSWNSYAGSSSYQYQYDTTANFNSAVLVTGTTSSTSYSASNFYFGVRYHWRVRAINSRDTSAWSDVWSFTTPAVVTLQTPADESAIATVSQQLRWESIGNSITYQLQYDTSATFTSPILVTYNTSSTYYTASNLCYGGHYYWRVRATNNAETSNWSDVWEFNTQETVILTSPSDGYTLTDVTTYINWESYPGTSSYQYQYDTVPTFDSPLSSMISTSNTSANLTGLQFGKTYYWHVRAVNSSNASVWSETWTFNTPSAVGLISPENGYVSTTISNTLNWNYISGTSSYIYEIDTVPTFDSPVYASNSTSSTSYSLNNLYYGTTYYWRVKAHNSNSLSDWSDVWHFTTPARTTLSSPEDGTDITTLSQTIYWNSCSGTNTYQYQCDTANTFDSPVLISGTRGSSYSYASLSSLCFESTHYWRVRCINSVDTSDWSDVWTFNTVGRMTLSSPADLTAITGTTQSLSWNSYSGATRYEYQYDTTTTFNSPIAYSSTTTSTSTSIYSLAYNVRYYWHVRAINSRDTSAWSDIWSFTTPGAITLVSPIDGYVSSSLSNSLQWNGISGSSYRYELDTVPTFDSPFYYYSTTSSTSTSVSTLYYGKTYYWRVAACNGNDTSDYSAVWSFTTPARTTLSSPNSGTQLSSLSQYFYWNTLSGTTTYQYQLDTVATFDSPAAFTGTRSSIYNYVSLNELFFESTIYWRVRCINSVDTSDWSDAWTVVTTGAMTLSSPYDGTALTSTNTYLYWNSYYGASYYQYEYDTTATFDSPAVSRGITSSTSCYASNLRFGVTYYWHVRAVNSRDSSAWSDTWTFSLPINITLISPADGTALTSVSTSFSWSGISNSTALLQKDTVPTFDSPALTSNTTSSTSISLSNLYYGATHYWRVAAYNSTDTSDWSDVWTFTTPAKTTLSSPADGTAITSLSQSIYWNTLSGTTTYQYEYDTVPTFNSPALQMGTRSSSYNYVSLSNLYFESNIYWRVRCINSVDTSDWSDTWHFTTTGSMYLISPADNSSISSMSVSLSWSSYNGASGYVYEYDTDPNFNSADYHSGYSYYTSVSISGLRYSSTYYWRARAVNSYDSSAWTPAWKFTTPGTVTLTSPANQTLASGTDITLQWDGISGSDYIYDIDTVPTFNSPYRMTGTSYYTSRSLSSLYYGTTYYWRVAATNGSDTTAWSTVWSFTTPAAVTLSSPANGSVTYSTSQYLYWDAISGSYYRYEFDETPGFNSANLRTGTTSSTSQYFSGLSYGNTYYWRIQAYNSNDEAEWSATWSFTIQSSLFPTAPTLLSPANGSTNIATGGRVLTWTSLANASNYQLQLGTDSTFVNSATYTVNYDYYLMNGLMTNTTYYWRVRGANGNEYSPWSVVWHFTTSNCSTYAPTDIVTACESYTWRGRTITESGVYRDTVPQVNSCDSIYVLSLTINHNVQNDITITAQDSYVWNGTTYTTSGDYSITFTSAAGCDSTVTLHLTITSGIVDNTLLAGLKVYPNPTTGEITVHIADYQSISEIKVYDMMGQLVMVAVPEGDDTKLDLSQSTPGMYLMRFISDGRIVGTSKVIVTR